MSCVCICLFACLCVSETVCLWLSLRSWGRLRTNDKLTWTPARISSRAISDQISRIHTHPHTHTPTHHTHTHTHTHTRPKLYAAVRRLGSFTLGFHYPPNRYPKKQTPRGISRSCIGTGYVFRKNPGTHRLPMVVPPKRGPQQKNNGHRTKALLSPSWDLCVGQNQTTRGQQVLVHVSTFQGNSFGGCPIFHPQAFGVLFWGGSTMGSTILLLI